MQWHTLPANAPLQKPDEFEKAALEKKRSDAELCAAALPVELLLAYLGRWVCGGVLRVSVERDAGRRCVPVV